MREDFPILLCGDSKMYLVREGDAFKPTAVFQELTNDSAGEKGKLMFFPHYGGAHYFAQTGIPEMSLIRWCSHTFIRPGKVFLDIGAHVGTYTFNMAPGSAHTWAFECTPRTFCYLAANVALHGLEDKVTVQPCALGEKNTTVEILVRSGDGGGNGRALGDERDDGCRKVKVEMRTLDSFTIENIGFIKMDVEGFEKHVLLGGVETLKRSNYPPIVFESWGAPSGDDVFKTLSELGYRYQRISGADNMWLATHPLYHE
jgi:FkbM family methyltransferase